MGLSRRFELRYGRATKLLLIVFASGPGRSGIVVGEAELEVTMGVSFRGRAARETIASVRRLHEKVISRGVHGWWGDWLVNGAGDRLVELRFEPPMRARVLGFPIRVRRLRVSVDAPDGLVDALVTSSPGTP